MHAIQCLKFYYKGCHKRIETPLLYYDIDFKFMDLSKL